MTDRDYSRLLPELLKKLFLSEPSRAEASKILSTYGSEVYHREKGRVQVGILRLSGSNLAKIKRNTELACMDYRDLLVAAEFPLTCSKSRLKLEQPEEYEKLARKEIDQYDEWINGILNS